MKSVRTISLFSGCGGSNLGLKRLGYNVVWANDISKAACETYSDNVGSVIECGDIAGFNRFPKAEFLVGCYPCQGFTQGGRRDAKDSINFLYQQFDRVLRIVNPKAFVVENVNGMAYGENTLLLYNQLCRYRLAGYRVKWHVLNAENYGVAQSRRRAACVADKPVRCWKYPRLAKRQPNRTRHRIPSLRMMSRQFVSQRFHHDLTDGACHKNRHRISNLLVLGYT